MPSLIAVWDWDWSSLNENTDVFVPEALAPGLLSRLRRSHPEMPWTSLMDAAAGQLHARGVRREDLERALSILPFFQEVPRAMEAVASAGGANHVLSDANQFYIAHGAMAMSVTHLLRSIVTNPASFDDAGRLRILPRTPPSAPHGCARCPPNLCKGKELEGMAAAHWAGSAETRVIYIGDGGGDVCACLRLGPRDVVAAREGRDFALLPALTTAPLAREMRARVRPWRDGAALLAILQAFIAEEEG